MSGSRITQAKEALRAGVSALGQGQSAGLRSYSGGCGFGGRLLVEPAANNRDALKGAIDGLYAGGGTPTPDALRAAARDFPADAKNKLVILISDGQSTCGDPCPVARQLMEDTSTSFRAHTVGFNAPDAAEGELACIAAATGGDYYTATDAAGLTKAISDALAGSVPEYVAVGDSTTTGFSIPACDGNKIQARNGCSGQPPAIPYPQRIAESGDTSIDDLNRVGIWGDTFKRAVESYDRGNNGDQSSWEPQLASAEKATDLVTVSLGANDMEWSKIEEYVAACVGARTREVWGRTVTTGAEVKENTCLTHVNKKADALRPSLVRAFDVLKTPQKAGATVAVALYYNPLNDRKQLRFRPDRDCSLLHNVARIVVGRLNVSLKDQANARGFEVADLGRPFAGHGAGSADPYVFGTDCEIPIGGLTSVHVDIDLRDRKASIDKEKSIAEAAKRFDPHPNNAGTQVQSATILEVIK